MSTKEIAELIEIVTEINDKLYEQQVSQNNVQLLSIEIPWNEPYVMWLGKCIWNSDDDGRKWIEEGPSISHGEVCTDDIVPAHYEPWEPYLKREMQKIIDEISKLKL